MLLCFLSSGAQTRLASIFSNNMVLQQNDSVTFWGTAMPTSQVSIIASWSPRDTVRTSANENGRWSVKMKTPKADLVAHTVRCNELKLSNVMLGEVWLCSGQSNMQWSVNEAVLNGEKEALSATYPNIRIYQVPLVGADTPQEYLEASWTTCTPETMRRASALGYFFSRALFHELNVPIGMISSAWGGTSAEAWVPQDAFDEQMLANLCTDKNPWRPVAPGKTYNQMIHPFINFALAGVIWYQGETNRPWAAYYDKLMQRLITSWRARFARELPFYFVQIAPFNYTGGKDTFAAQLREAQQMTADALPRTGMVIVSDLVDNINNIHPLNKQQVGLRLANYALAECYGRNDIKNYKSPTYKSMSVKGNKVTLEFNNSTSLHCSSDKIEGFTIAGTDGTFVMAEASINGSTVEVWAKDVKRPVAVRYCFDDYTFGNLKNVADLPVAPFRTDKNL